MLSLSENIHEFYHNIASYTYGESVRHFTVVVS